MRIGFIGLGAMGAPMALNLLEGGHAVRGFDMRAGARRRAGRAPAAPPRPARPMPPRDAELLWLMVVTGEQAEAVLFDAAARSRAAAGQHRRVGACTQAPAQAQRTAARLAAMGLAMLDAPVSGGVKGATAAALTDHGRGAGGGVRRAPAGVRRRGRAHLRRRPRGGPGLDCEDDQPVAVRRAHRRCRRGDARRRARRRVAGDDARDHLACRPATAGCGATAGRA